MKLTSFLLGIAGLLAIVSLPSTSAYAQATRTWVSGVGDDVNPCSRTAPCKTFAGAISKTAAGGEINCLDPGGYGTLTITKSILIDCGGTFGSTLNSGGINGFNVNDSASGTPGTVDVIIRNVSIDGAGLQPGVNGIRFISGRSLRVENVFITNQLSGAGISVDLTTFGTLTVRNVTFDRTPRGVFLKAAAGKNIVASISDSKFNGMTVNAVEADANAFVGLNNNVFSTIGGSAIAAMSASSTVYAKDNMITNSNVGIGANVSGAKIRATGNGIFGTNKAFNVVAGGVFLSANDNKIDINPGDSATGSLTLR